LIRLDWALVLPPFQGGGARRYAPRAAACGLALGCILAGFQPAQVGLREFHFGFEASVV
jgi:hypothetical protein